MTITVNGEVKDIAAQINLGELLELLALPSERIAIELNREVVRKKDWAHITIKDADKIEVVRSLLAEGGTNSASLRNEVLGMRNAPANLLASSSTAFKTILSSSSDCSTYL